MIYPVYIVFKHQLHLNIDQLSVVSFTISGFFFGISYDLPDFYWVFLGLSLAFTDKAFSILKHTNMENLSIKYH
jgi:hypothetical protein